MSGNSSVMQRPEKINMKKEQKGGQGG